MTWVAWAIGIVSAVAAVTWLLWRSIRWAGQRGEERGEIGERERALRESAERAAVADEIASQPISGDPDVVADGWDEYRRHRMRGVLRVLQKTFANRAEPETLPDSDGTDEPADQTAASGK